jgi:hypothetical protein
LDSGRSPAEIAVDRDAAEGWPMSETNPLSENPPAGCRPTTGSPYRQSTFTELMLNASVEKADESRLSTQGRKVLALFREAYRKGQTVSTAQLMEISAQYQGRVYECRRWLVGQGYCIDLVKRGKDGLNFYAVVPLAKSEFYKSHKARLDLECAL